jgi:DNA-binding Lrp family transcriptional regulator
VGRKRQTEPPVPATYIREAFHVRQDGRVIRRDHRLAALAHEPTGYRGPDGTPIVGVAYQGRTRRIALLRLAYVLAFDQWPKGQVQPRDGDEWNGAASNLRVIRRGRNPFATGKSSLQRRQAVDAALLMALADHSDASVARLGEIIGLSESGACTRLTKLERKGLTISPQCVPGRAWALTAQGRELALQRAAPLDDLDRELLIVLAREPSRLMALKRQIGVCVLTVRRRIDRLVERGLVDVPDGCFRITDEGRGLLPKPWLNPERIKASAARDVLARRSPDAATPAEAGRMGARVRWRKAGLMDERIRA